MLGPNVDPAVEVADLEAGLRKGAASAKGARRHRENRRPKEEAKKMF